MEKRPSQVESAGHLLKCPICGGENLWHREAQLNTRVLTFLDLDGVNPQGSCSICEHCRHILWFYSDEEKR